MKRLKSIEEEKADCQAALSSAKIGNLIWHLHHDQLVEEAESSIGLRISWIYNVKPPKEQARRFRLMRKVQHPSAALYRAVKFVEEEYRAQHNLSKSLAHLNKVAAALHRKECPDCPWDGKTIFPKRRAKK